MSRARRLTGLAAGLLLVAASAHADPAKCEKTLITGLLKFKKTFLKVYAKCLDAENAGKIPGPCLDPGGQLKLSGVSAKVSSKIASACVAGDLTTLGYSGSCNFKPGAQGAEAACAAMPATTPQELTSCLMCWKSAELARYAAILYASHANEVCDGNLGATSPTCSPLDCTTPLPDQRNLNGGDVDCQRAIGKAGNKYLVSREKLLEKCGLAGGTRTSHVQRPMPGSHSPASSISRCRRGWPERNRSRRAAARRSRRSSGFCTLRDHARRSSRIAITRGQ